MQICGLNKTTLLDYPGHLAATVFFGGCNFRCPFCHNGGLVLFPETQQSISKQEILSFLSKRAGIIEGVCISGGEPTLVADLADFIREIKSMGFLIKLDTNGYMPSIIKQLCEEHLIDYIAMDIKSSISHYHTITGLPLVDISRIEESIAYIMNCSVEYEFRTTVVKEFHNEEIFKEIGELIKGCKSYYLQPFRDNNNVISKDLHSYSNEELLSFCRLLSHYAQHVSIRAMD